MRTSAAVLIAALSGLAVGALAESSPVQANAPTAAVRMSQPGPEVNALTQQSGTWDVIATLWPAPGVPPIVTAGLVAQRAMIGSISQEVMQPAPGSQVADFRRLDYLNFDRVEGRWKYVSMDTRFPVSIMPAWSSGPSHDGEVTLQFEPQAFVGFGSAVEGRLMVSDLVISTHGPDKLVKEQHVMMADGTGRRWLFARYEYSRRH